MKYLPKIKISVFKLKIKFYKTIKLNAWLLAGAMVTLVVLVNLAQQSFERYFYGETMVTLFDVFFYPFLVILHLYFLVDMGRYRFEPDAKKDAHLMNVAWNIAIQTAINSVNNDCLNNEITCIQQGSGYEDMQLTIITSLNKLKLKE